MKHLLTAAALLALAMAPTPASAQPTTEFTYQGDVAEGGNAAKGAFDMEFTLWSALAGGVQIGSAVTVNDVPVSDGVFTVGLDFGAAAFNNQDRFLEITVEGFTLTPRQPITRSPYAAQTRGIFVNDQNLVGVGTTTPNASARLTVNAAGQQQAIYATSGASGSPTIYAFNGNIAGSVLRADEHPARRMRVARIEVVPRQRSLHQQRAAAVEHEHAECGQPNRGIACRKARHLRPFSLTQGVKR